MNVGRASRIRVFAVLHAGKTNTMATGPPVFAWATIRAAVQLCFAVDFAAAPGDMSYTGASRAF
jgi:hypothetical protein